MAPRSVRNPVIFMHTNRLILAISALVLSAGACPSLRADGGTQNRREYNSATGGILLFGEPAAGTSGSTSTPRNAAPAVPRQPPPVLPSDRRDYNSATGGIPVTLGVPAVTGAPKAPVVSPLPPNRHDFQNQH